MSLASCKGVCPLSHVIASFCVCPRDGHNFYKGEDVPFLAFCFIFFFSSLFTTIHTLHPFILPQIPISSAHFTLTLNTHIRPIPPLPNISKMPTKKVIKGSKNTSTTLDVEAALSNPAMFLNNGLATANTQKQRAETLMEIQIRCGEIGEQVVRVMALAQDLIEKERFWEHLDIDRETMWKNIDYENSIEPAMERLR